MKQELPDYLSIKNNKLYYQNINLYELVKKYNTPLEVAYTDMINLRVKQLKNLFQDAIAKYQYNAKYFYAYATKANYYSEVVSTTLNYIDYMETSSGYDLDIVEKLYYAQMIKKGYTILCNGFKKGYYFEKILHLRKLGLNIVPIIENMEELELFLNQEESFDIGMRINIDAQLVNTFLNGKRSGSAIDTRFGIYFEDMVEAAKRIQNSSNLTFKVFHFHLGGTITNIEQYITFFQYIYRENYCKLKKIYPDLEYFDFGGGFPVQYHLDFHFNYQELVEKMIQSIKNISKELNCPEPNLIGEHGRYTVADHSFFLYEIEIVKKSDHDMYWYLINSSLMNYLPDAWALGQDFIILPLNLLENKRVKVKLGGLTCDPDDTYYKQEKNNYLWLPEVKKGQKLYIGIFAVGAYQEMIAGVGGVHHCMIPEGNELIITKKGKLLIYNHITNNQSARDMLQILDYDNTHNLLQYSTMCKIQIKEFSGNLKEEYNKLFSDFPKKEIFPYKNIKKAYDNKDYTIIELYDNDIFIGYAFLALLKQSKIVILNYLCIIKKYRNRGYGHIFVNELKSLLKKYDALLVEVEKPYRNTGVTLKHKRIKFYEELDFNRQDTLYEYLETGKKNYESMYLYMCNLKNIYNYSYKKEELKKILDEYYRILFGDDYSEQYKLS